MMHYDPQNMNDLYTYLFTNDRVTAQKPFHGSDLESLFALTGLHLDVERGYDSVKICQCIDKGLEV